jgi:hypothetical protein
MKMFALIAALLFFASPIRGQAPAQAPKRKTISISLAVESEGPKGEWIQSAKDLTKTQLQRLETLIRAELAKQPLLVLVEPNDPKTHVHVSVVAAQVEHEGKSNWVIVSSVLTLANDKQHGNNDVLATHDVIAGPDLPSVARTVGYQVASATLRFMTGILK